MRKIAGMLMMSALLGLSGPALAGDAAAGKTKAASCAGCHGPEGISANPMWPKPHGQAPQRCRYQQPGRLLQQSVGARDAFEGLP
jgi:cytochrome c553